MKRRQTRGKRGFAKRAGLRPLRILFCAAVLGATGFLLFFSGCGGKRPPVPASPPVGSVHKPPVQPSLAGGNGPRVRILLREGFKSLAIRNSSLAEEVEVRVRSGKVEFFKVSGKRQQLLQSGSGSRLDPAKGHFLLLDRTPYRGAIEVFINPLRVPVAVNELPLEDYLRSVIPKELNPRRFPAQSVQAQAIAARTYAWSFLHRYASRGFDLYSDHRSQIYQGVQSENELADEAVRKTMGVVALYKGQLIEALYSSTCGGRTEGAEFLNGHSVPYLRGGDSCPDDNSPYHSWKEQIPASRIETNLGIGELKKVEILSKTHAGRASEMLFEGTKGSRKIKGYQIRSVLGIRSNYIVKLDVSKSGGRIKEIRIQGHGWGHGIGLCQYGAAELASRGESHEKILKYYYHGIDLEKRY